MTPLSLQARLILWGGRPGAGLLLEETILVILAGLLVLAGLL